MTLSGNILIIHCNLPFTSIELRGSCRQKPLRKDEEIMQLSQFFARCLSAYCLLRINGLRVLLVLTPFSELSSIGSPLLSNCRTGSRSPPPAGMSLLTFPAAHHCGGPDDRVGRRVAFPRQGRLEGRKGGREGGREGGRMNEGR